MAKTTAWLVTLIGILWLLPLLGVASLGGVTENGVAGWLVGISFLIIGLTKLSRNYSKRR